MAFDERLAERIRAYLSRRANLTERRMFGGIAFMVDGNMCCGIIGDRLMLRLGPDAAAALREPHTLEMDFTGRAMKGMIYVEPAGTQQDAELRRWLSRAVKFASSLPKKAPTSPARGSRSHRDSKPAR